jgi:outer membrane receptor for ferrienterochelin and colicins
VIRFPHAASTATMLVVVALFLATTSPLVRADDDATGVVVTGTKTEHTEDEAPVPTQVITRERIEATATDNVESLLSQIPDLYVRRNEQFSLGASTVRMQGLDANKVAITIDGRRFRGGIDGVVDLRDIPIAGVERIEIIRGPASSLYGSDAMAGVINIRTRAGSDKLYLKAEAGGGDAGKRTFSATNGYHIGNLRYVASAYHDAVAIAELYGPISAQYAGDDADDLQTRTGGQIHLEYPLDRHTLRVDGDFLEERNPLSTSHDYSGNASWEWAPRAGWRFETNAGAYGYDRENDLPGFAEDIDYYDVGTETRASRTAGEVLGADHIVTFGFRSRNESLESPSRVIGDDLSAPAIDADAYQLSPFVQTETLVGTGMSLVLGFGLDDHESYAAELSPRMTVTWRPLRALQLSTTIGRGFRAPDLLQLYDIDVNNVAIVGDRVTGYAIVGNPDLKPETDYGATFFVEYTGFRGVRLGGDAFIHDLRDLIGNELVCTAPDDCKPGFVNPLPELDGLIFSYANVAAARTKGFNVGVGLRPLDWTNRWTGLGSGEHSIEVDLGFGYLDTENNGDIAGEAGQELPFRPNVRVLPAFGYRNSSFDTTLRFWGEYDGRQYSDFANTEAGKIDPYWVWSFKLDQGLGSLAKRFGLDAGDWLDHLGVFVQGDNIFDVNVDDAVGAAGPTAMVRERNFLAGARITIGK